MKKTLALLFFLFVSQSIIISQEKSKYLLSSADILKIMEVSKVIYVPTLLENPDDFKYPKYQTLGDQYYISEEGESSTLLTYSLSEKGNSSFNLAEQAYSAKDYDKAIAYYNDVLLTDKNYYKAYTYIGDMCFMKGDYDSAKYYFNLAIKNNFIDYTAHWFLSDTYVKTKDLDQALKEITIAHLLNRNHLNIFKKLIQIRELIGKKWNEWDLTPICNTYKKDDQIIIEATEDWLGYAFAEAVWKYEPGFTEDIFGKSYNDGELLYEKEAAGILANMNSKSMGEVTKIVEAGQLQEMIMYELIGRKYPTVMLLIPTELRDRIIEYVNKYH